MPGTLVAGLLLVLEVEPRTLGGRPATILTLGAPTGRLCTAPFWSSEQRAVASLRRGDVVEVRGRIGAYRGRLQLEVARLRKAPTELADPNAFLPAVPDPLPLWSALDRWRAEIGQPALAAVLALFYDDPAFRTRFETCPGSPAGHHALLGGLLQHTHEVAAIGRAIAAARGANHDLVLTGALLHDIGKLDAYTWDGRFEITDSGALLGHVVLGARMLDRRVRQALAPPCNAEELELLLHLVLAHHGKLEFGSPVQPMTLEAEILHFADDASAKSASLADALADPANFAASARVSTRIWQLDRRRVFRSVDLSARGARGTRASESSS